MSMILSPYNMNIVQDFSFIVSTSIKQQILEPSLTVSPNTTMLDAVTPEDITKQLGILNIPFALRTVFSKSSVNLSCLISQVRKLLITLHSRLVFSPMGPKV